MKVDKILWGAMVFSTFIYALIAYMTVRGPVAPFEAALKQRFTLIFYGLALASFIAGLMLPSLMRGPAQTKMIAALGIFESCAIYGLMAAFLVGDWRLFIPPWIVTLIGMMRAYPSEDATPLPR